MGKLHVIAVAALGAVLLGGGLAQAGTSNYGAHLRGADEVPARETRAQGQANFQLKEGGSLGYRVAVANIDNVVASHIHCAAAGTNGPVGVTLFTGGGLGPVNGVLASGAIQTPDAGNSCGWQTLDDVIAAIESGAAYVNVHTNDGVPPGNTGPGDFQSGEIRGQLP